MNCGAHRAPSCGDCILNPALARWLWFSWCSGGDCHWDQRLNVCVDPGMRLRVNYYGLFEINFGIRSFTCCFK